MPYRDFLGKALREADDTELGGGVRRVAGHASFAEAMMPNEIRPLCVDHVAGSQLDKTQKGASR